MQRTEKLYEDDSHLKSFTATVQSCARQDDGYTVILDRTAFFPEGGGQPADTGMLEGIPIIDVHEKDGVIVHTAVDAIEPGKTVQGEIDWESRLTHMQQHSGEHILSGIVHALYNYDNVGFHIGREVTTLDFSGELIEADMEKAELMANDAVYANIPIRISYPSPEALKTLAYRSKKEISGEVRIVTIDTCDQCACCGTHVKATGEVGSIKIISSQRYKGGTRLGIVCGKRALSDHRTKQRNVSEISVMLSAKPDEVSTAVQKLIDEGAKLREKIDTIQTRLFECKAAALQTGGENICVFEEELSSDELRQYCFQLCMKFRRALVFSGNDETGYKYALGSSQEDMRPLGKELNAAFSGRGGGKSDLVQGAVQGTRDDIKAYVENHGYSCPK